MSSIRQKSHTSALVLLSIFLGFNIASGLVIALLLSVFQDLSPYLFFLPAVIFLSYYFGFKLGLLTTLISIGSMLAYLFYPAQEPLLATNIIFYIELTLFLIIGIGISYIIDRAKNQDKVSIYQKRLRQNMHIIETLEKNYESAQKEIQARDQFLAIASHELKTPVTSMLLQVQTAIHNIRNVSLANFSVSSLLKMLEGTEQQSKRLSRMVNDLLNLSLITTGKLDLEPEPTDLTAIVNDISDRFAERIKKDNITITVAADKKIVGNWDKVRIEQAVVNLVSNAIKYGNNKPIHIALSNSHNRAKLAVSDQGIGISPEHQKRVFERFERAVSSREYKGLGVGLYITHQIVNAHHGKISINSKPNQGTTFIIELPLQYS